MKRLSFPIFVAIAGGCVVDAPHFVLPEKFHVGGTVAGLWDGAGISLHLQAPGIDTVLSVPSNGPFRFDDGLDDAASYVVTVATQPPEHTCEVVAGIGSIDAGEVTDIEVTCDGPPVAVALSAPIEWSFDPRAVSQEVDTSVLIQESTVTVTAPDADSISLDGSTVLSSGVPSAPVPFASGHNELDVDVTVGNLSKRFSIDLVRGAVPIDSYASLLGDNTDPPDRFGQAVALDGDVVAVGAPGEASGTGSPDDNSAANAGAVYVFRRTGSTWQQEAYLKPSRISADDEFGASVALRGDTLVIGAPDLSDEEGGTRVGRVYVFLHSGNSWVEDQVLEPPSGTSGDRFGASVSLDAATLIVGAPFSSFGAGGTWSGTAYVFTHPTTTWLGGSPINAPNAEANDTFGYSVAVSGDRIAIGAIGEASCATGIGGSQANNGCGGAGAVYVFRRNGFAWPFEAYVKGLDPVAGDGFGTDVALTNDGATLVASQSSYRSGTIQQRVDTTWTVDTQLDVPPPTEPDANGLGISAVGDLVGISGTLFRESAPGTWVTAETVAGTRSLTRDGMSTGTSLCR